MKTFIFFIYLITFSTSVIAEDALVDMGASDAGDVSTEQMGWNPLDWTWWKQTKEAATDVYDRATNSKIAKSMVALYGTCYEYAKSVNKQYDTFMRGLRITNEELRFIQSMAQRIERIKNRGWSSNTFWENMQDLELSMDEMEYMGASLKEFDEMCGQSKDVFKKLNKWKPPSFKKAFALQKSIWGGVSDDAGNDDNYSQRPDVKLITANAYSLTRVYGMQGSMMEQLYESAEKDDSNKVKLDTMTGVPSNLLAFQNAYYQQGLTERALYLDRVKNKMIATCNAINSIGAMDDSPTLQATLIYKSYENADRRF